MVRHRGYVNLFGGLKNQPQLCIDSNLIHYKECFVMGSHGALPVHHEAAMGLIARGEVRARNYISATFRLERSRGPSPTTNRVRPEGRGGALVKRVRIAPSLMCADFLT